MKICLQALPVLLIIFSISCKKDAPANIQEVELNLRLQTVINDSAVVLSWDSYGWKDFKEYRLIRTYPDALKWWDVSAARDTVFISGNRHANSYQDLQVPMTTNVKYTLEVSAIAGELQSKEVVHERKQGAFFDKTQDALIDTARDFIYVVNKEDGYISLYNYRQNLLIKKISASPYIGYCGLGNPNGESELYVPRSDGWVDIYDATTLLLKDRLNVEGREVSSVIYNNGLLFVSTADSSQASGGKDRSVKVYSRSTKQLITRAGYYTPSRLFLIPGTRTELIDVVNKHMAIRLLHYKFDEAGNLLSEKEDPYNGLYVKDPATTKVFPAGNLVITTRLGGIYDTTLNLKFHLSNNPITGYRDFAFNETGSIIYSASFGSSKTIEARSYPGNSLIRSYPTRLPPIKIFRDGQQLISLSSNMSPGLEYPWTPAYFFFETINL